MTGDGILVIAVAAHVALQLSFVLRALLRPHREAATRTAWILLILAMPAVGMIAYVLFGETNIGQKRLASYMKVAAHTDRTLNPVLKSGCMDCVDGRYRHLFFVGKSVNGLGPVRGNSVEVLADTNRGFDRLVQDIDTAQKSVHLLFYIWLEDRNGTRVADAAMRAARRGVTVRVMVDDIGSRAFLASDLVEDMKAAGVRVTAALPVRPLFLHPIKGRIDLRNHRKIVVIDNRTSYCGSANCADPEFRIKPRFAPWVDLMVRFEGPVALQTQYIFAQDWMAHANEDITSLLSEVPTLATATGTIAQVIGTGPTIRASAMPEIFEALIHTARKELIITTPYYVPTDGIQSALCAAGRRGVNTILILPKNNDSFIVAAASRSYYPELIEAGVRIFEYPHGLLHAKALTVDGDVALIGSANLDRRSFELNYENNVLLHDREVTSSLVQQQETYRASSHLIDADTVSRWPKHRLVWNNTVAMMGPVL